MKRIFLKQRALLGIEKSCAENPKARRWLRRQLAGTKTFVAIRAELFTRFAIRISNSGLSNYARRHEAEIFTQRRRGSTAGEMTFRLIVKAPGARFVSVRLVPEETPAVAAPKRRPGQRGKSRRP